MRTLSVRLDDHTDSLLRAYCARTGMSQTEAVKEGIVLLSQRPGPRPAELAESMGLVGAFDSGVGDLGREHSRHLKDELAARHRRE
jgi:hypothetical protein